MDVTIHTESRAVEPKSIANALNLAGFQVDEVTVQGVGGANARRWSAEEERIDDLFGERREPLNLISDLMSEEGENAEYDRACVEIACGIIGVSSDSRGYVETKLRAQDF